ncbi:TIGR04283 family arsenosugar biosynthesis glycosyltransferase [Oceaniserpentilla sp. 4NH20-0058]|uniref:TIGR04283 family arsenosugar biosynthesis glycosyltransferase n=1 Tax=Oceaniserpentilla sp. 4NH20-0058 TaxID=3127660 RepID=UPI0031069B15
MNQFNVSIIVPVLNESTQVTALINRLLILSDYVKEIIIVDGGSEDGTQSLLAKHFKVLESHKGRAKQMNLGAQSTQSTWLVFLHGDTQFTPAHLKTMIDEASLHQWGRFNIRLDAKGLAYRVIEWFINQRSWLSGIATGDQCIFVRKRLFEQLDGFSDIPLMEDVDFSKRAKRTSKPKCLNKKVITSARRWKKFGVVNTVWLMWKLRLYFWFGVAPEKLAKLYR